MLRGFNKKNYSSAFSACFRDLIVELRPRKSRHLKQLSGSFNSAIKLCSWWWRQGLSDANDNNKKGESSKGCRSLFLSCVALSLSLHVKNSAVSLCVAWKAYVAGAENSSGGSRERNDGEICATLANLNVLFMQIVDVASKAGRPTSCKAFSGVNWPATCNMPLLLII